MTQLGNEAGESEDHDDADRETKDDADTRRMGRRRIRLQAAGIVAAALIVVAISAVLLEQRMNDEGVDFGVLTAPITPADENRAELARKIRDAVVVVDADPGMARGGFRRTGRGWVFGNLRNGNDDSLAQTLATTIGDDLDALVSSLAPDDDVLVHSCGDGVGVFVRSSVQIDEADLSWWSDNDCSRVPLSLVGTPGFFVIGRVGGG